MDRLQYETGASTVTMTGLANANFKTMEFKGGAGSYTLDFSGQLRTDATVRVKAGVGTMRIVVPAQTAARVTVSGSFDRRLGGGVLDRQRQDLQHARPREPTRRPRL